MIHLEWCGGGGTAGREKIEIKKERGLNPLSKVLELISNLANNELAGALFRFDLLAHFFSCLFPAPPLPTSNWGSPPLPPRRANPSDFKALRPLIQKRMTMRQRYRKGFDWARIVLWIRSAKGKSSSIPSLNLQLVGNRLFSLSFSAFSFSVFREAFNRSWYNQLH